MAAPLPRDLPVPDDDGATDHLLGVRAPGVALASTDGTTVRLDQLPPGRTVLYVYPLTGRADLDLPDGWDAIPGARGCTNEACDFRDHHADLLAAGAAAVYGLSTQTSGYQAELVERLRLPFAVLSPTPSSTLLPTSVCRPSPPTAGRSTGVTVSSCTTASSSTSSTRSSRLTSMPSRSSPGSPINKS